MNRKYFNDAESTSSIPQTERVLRSSLNVILISTITSTWTSQHSLRTCYMC